MADRGDGLDASTEQRIDRFLDDQLVEYDVPGASIAVFDADGVLYATGYGCRTLAETAPATADTRYTAASITKTVTAIAILQLADRGDLALDDEIRNYQSTLNDVPGDPITVRELLTHTSGMPSDYVGPDDHIATPRDLQLRVDGAADRRVTDDPPTMYYNSGYGILTDLVEAADGRSYADYVTEEVLTPLSMDRSTFDWGVLDTDDDAMTGYVTESGEWMPVDDHDELLDAHLGIGGLVSPVTDLARLWRCLLADGHLGGERLLPADLVAAMTSPQAPLEPTLDGGEDAYGYGLMLEPLLGERLFGHSGAMPWAAAYVGALPGRALGVALATNTPAPAPIIAKGVLALAAGEPPEQAVPSLGLWEKLDAVTGTYEGYQGGRTATVERDGGHLAVTLDGDDTFPAFPETAAPADYSFYRVTTGARRSPVEFRETDDGLMMLFDRERLDRT